MNYDNPAGRLLELLKKGKTFSHGSNCREVWKEILDAESESEMLSKLGMLMSLANESALKIEEDFPEEVDAVSHWKGQLTNAFLAQNLQGNWQSFIQGIDDHSIRYLTSESKLLQLTSNTKPLKDKDVDRVRDQLSLIYEEVINSNIEIEVRKYVIRYLRKIMNSIDDYFLTGALPILEAVETTIGHVHVDKKYKSFMLDTDLGKKILDTLGATANVVTVAVGLPQLTTAIAMIVGNA